MLESHPARGAWIEIYRWRYRYLWPSGRTPQGVRGLKFLLIIRTVIISRSHPARGAWIEMQSHRVSRLPFGSHPARGAWIEMSIVSLTVSMIAVAPRKGCVD